MGICATWIEGEALAIEMMQKREKTTVKPKRMECTMRLGSTWGELNYMKDPDEHYNIEEVLLEDENGTLWEFDLDIKEEVFDGWDTVYPDTIIIRKKEE